MHDDPFSPHNTEGELHADWNMQMYLKSPAISRSGLWRVYHDSPADYQWYKLHDDGESALCGCDLADHPAEVFDAIPSDGYLCQACWEALNPYGYGALKAFYTRCRNWLWRESRYLPVRLPEPKRVQPLAGQRELFDPEEET